MQEPKPPAFHYAWVIVLGGTLTTFAALGLGRFALGMLLPAMSAELRETERKRTAGARFFQTQAIFDIDKLARATEVVHANGGKVIAGILLLRSAKAIDFINTKLAGLMVPMIQTGIQPVLAALGVGR